MHLANKIMFRLKIFLILMEQINYQKIHKCKNKFKRKINLIEKNINL